MQRGVQLFLQWAMMQGVAMLLQNRYQRQRLYTRIALGKVLLLNSIFDLLYFSFFVVFTFFHHHAILLYFSVVTTSAVFFVNAVKIFFFPIA